MRVIELCKTKEADNVTIYDKWQFAEIFRTQRFRSLPSSSDISYYVPLENVTPTGKDVKPICLRRHKRLLNSLGGSWTYLQSMSGDTWVPCKRDCDFFWLVCLWKSWSLTNCIGRRIIRWNEIKCFVLIWNSISNLYRITLSPQIRLVWALNRFIKSTNPT